MQNLDLGFKIFDIIDSMDSIYISILYLILFHSVFVLYIRLYILYFTDTCLYICRDPIFIIHFHLRT